MASFRVWCLRINDLYHWFRFNLLGSFVFGITIVAILYTSILDFGTKISANRMKNKAVYTAVLVVDGCAEAENL